MNNSKRKVAIVSGGGLPVPNAEGGAVEALVNMLATENEKRGLVDLTVFSSWTAAAQEVADKKSNEDKAHTHYVLFRMPWFVKLMDKCMYWAAKNILHKHELMAYRYFAQRLWYGRKLSAYCAKHDFDRIVFENTLLPMRMLKKPKNTKYVDRTLVHMHNQLTHTFGMDEYLTRIRGYLTVSRYISREIENAVPGLDPAKCRVLRNCVDTERFNPLSKTIQEGGRAFRKELRIPENATVFLFSGRLTAEKGAEELLEAFVKADIPNAYLVIAGAYFFNSGMVSPFEQRLHELAERLKDRIKFTGFIDYGKMPFTYSMADVCCLPSIWDDPAPLAVIESLASGRPLITTYSGGIPEYADDKAAMLFDRDGNLVDNLAEAIAKLADDIELRERMGRHGYELSRRLTSEQFLRDFAELTE